MPTSSSAAPAIRIENASMLFHHKSHRRLLRDLVKPRNAPGDFYALRDISFTVAHGESIAIMGHNGAGKSTLLSLLCGLTPPTTGSVEINGKVAALLELGSGFHQDLTGRENVMLNAALLGFPRERARALVPDIVRFAELEDFLDDPLRTYSAGMVLRLAFAVAVHSEPGIVLIDEVLAVGDASFQEKSFGRIVELKEQGRTLVVVSHVTDMVRKLCSRGLMLEKGRLVKDGPIEEVVDEYLLRQGAAATPPVP